MWLTTHKDHEVDFCSNLIAEKCNFGQKPNISLGTHYISGLFGEIQLSPTSWSEAAALLPLGNVSSSEFPFQFPQIPQREFL